MSLQTRESLIQRLRRGKAARRALTASHLAKTIAFQIRATRDKLGWSQEELAQKVGTSQNAISRMESPEYGRQSLSSLEKLAGELDVALIVRLVSYSEFIDWVSGTPRTEFGLRPQALAVPGFDEENESGVFDKPAIASRDAEVLPAGKWWVMYDVPIKGILNDIADATEENISNGRLLWDITDGEIDSTLAGVYATDGTSIRQSSSTN